MIRGLFVFFTTVFFLIAKDTVTVSISPIKYFVEQIAGETIDVITMVRPEANHESYEPKPAQMVGLAKSSIYFSSNLPFERAWLQRFKEVSPNIIIADITKNIKKIELSSHHHDEHEDEKHDEHDDDKLDPHVWLSPSLVKIQATNIANTLISTYPQNADLYKRNLDKFLANIETLHEEIKVKLSPIKNRNFLVFHPSWGYFANDYNLNQIAIEFDGKEPKPSDIISISKLVKEKDIKVMFTEPQVSQRSSQVIAKELNVKVVLIDPLAADWSDNMLKVAKTLAELE